MKTIVKILKILLVIGGLNWGLVAFNFNLVEAIFGFSPSLVTVLYILVGISAVVEIFRALKK
jgi:uncharacterized membrane protein YuzA (DUF378 family)